MLVRKARGPVAGAVAAATASTPFAEMVLEVRLVDLDVAGGKTAPVRDERRPEQRWAKPRCSHAVLGARDRRRGRRVRLSGGGSALTPKAWTTAST